MQASVWTNILAGLIRHALGIVGAWLVTKSYIDQQVHDDLLSKGTEQIVGLLLAGFAVAWSSRAKLYEWVKLKVARDAAPNASLAQISATTDALPVSEKMSIAVAAPDERTNPQPQPPSHTVRPGGLL